MSTGNAVLGSQRCYDQLEAIKPAKAHSAKNPRRTIAVKQVPNIGVKIAALEQALHQLLIFFCSIMCFLLGANEVTPLRLVQQTKEKKTSAEQIPRFQFTISGSHAAQLSFFARHPNEKKKKVHRLSGHQVGRD